MGDLVLPGQCLEGTAMNVSCRRGLRSLDTVFENGKKVYHFEAKEDVVADITRPVASTTLCEATSIDPDDQLKCKEALVTSLSNPGRPDVDHRTGTHKAMFYTFGKQTCVSIELSHDHILKGIEKRNREVREQVLRDSPLKKSLGL